MIRLNRDVDETTPDEPDEGDLDVLTGHDDLGQRDNPPADTEAQFTDDDLPHLDGPDDGDAPPPADLGTASGTHTRPPPP